MMRWQNGFLSVLAGVLCFGSAVSAGPQVLEVSPRYLEFTGYEGGANPAAQALSIWNSGHSGMDWTVTPDCNWIIVEPNSGTSSGEVDDANVIVNINGLAGGTYNCQLTVTGSGAPNSPQIVDVNLVVYEPIIELSTTYFEFGALEGGANPDDQVLGISNSGTGTLNWNIIEDCNWLTAEPNSGSSTGEVDDVNLSVDISGLVVGAYNCNLTVAGAPDPNGADTEIVEVVLRVRDVDGELHVPSEYGTIQAAINVALSGDTVIVASGTYTGAGNKNLDFGGRAITVRSLDPEDPCVVAVTVIDCENSGRGFYFHSDEGPSSVVSGLTITRGWADRGGGIYCNSSSPTIEHCVISYCDATSGWAFGGGIACVMGSRAVIFDCMVFRNISVGWDAIVYCEDGGYAYGGGIYCSSSCNVTVMNCVVAENQCRGGDGGNQDPPQCPAGDGGSAYGGGIFCAEGTTTIINCDVLNNEVVGGAGGAGSPAGSPGDANGGGVAGGAAIVSDCIIRGNDAEEVHHYWWVDDGPTVTYSDVQGGYSGVGNIDADPCFVSGLYGDYYLSQIAAGQAFDSPCVDVGSETWAYSELGFRTTRTDGRFDRGIVDIGYHYPSGLGSADLYRDWQVDFFDFDILGGQWLGAPGAPSADIAPVGLDGVVDGIDLSWFTDCWLDCYVTGTSNPNPQDGDSAVDPNTVLSWSAGDGALYHDVYFGMDANLVADANHLSGEFMGTVTDASFDPCGLDLNMTYYWRTDEVGPRCTTGGRVRSFRTAGIVSWWEFDEGSGSTAHDSAGSNDGTVYGATWTTGQVGSYALDFNGVSNYVDVGNDNSLKASLPITITGWVKLSGSGKIQRAISIDEQSPTYYGMWLQVDSTDKVHVGFGDGAGGTSQAYRRSKVGTTALGMGTWYHVAAVIRGAADMDIYINGADDAGSYSGSGGSLAYSSGNSAIGYENGARYYFDGAIDDVRVYDRALSASEVWQLYQSGL